MHKGGKADRKTKTACRLSPTHQEGTRSRIAAPGASSTLKWSDIDQAGSLESLDLFETTNFEKPIDLFPYEVSDDFWAT